MKAWPQQVAIYCPWCKADITKQGKFEHMNGDLYHAHCVRGHGSLWWFGAPVPIRLKPEPAPKETSEHERNEE